MRSALRWIMLDAAIVGGCLVMAFWWILVFRHDGPSPWVMIGLDFLGIATSGQRLHRAIHEWPHDAPAG